MAGSKIGNTAVLEATGYYGAYKTLTKVVLDTVYQTTN